MSSQSVSRGLALRIRQANATSAPQRLSDTMQNQYQRESYIALDAAFTCQALSTCNLAGRSRASYGVLPAHPFLVLLATLP